MNRKNICKILFLVLIVSLYFGVDKIQTTVKQMFFILRMNDTDMVRGYISSQGNLIMSFTLMIFQSVIPKVPYIDIIISNNYILGNVGGIIFSSISLSIAASISFFITRVYGKNFIDKINNTSLNIIRKYILKNGKFIVFALRAIPFISFDLISYIMGVTNIKFKDFFIGTVLGNLIIVTICSYNLEEITFVDNKGFYLFLVVLGVSIFIYTMINFVKNKKTKEGEYYET